MNCTKLFFNDYLVIGDGVLSIGRDAFAECPQIQTIISVSPTPPEMDDFDTFDATIYKHAILKVPLECKTRYWNAKYWEQFSYIEETDMTTYQGLGIVDLNIAQQKYSTFYDSKFAYQLSSGLSASVVTGMNKNKLTYKTIAKGGSKNDVIPKGVAVVLTGDTNEQTTCSLTPTESEETYTGTNLLRGSDAATTTTGDGSCWFYKLSYGASDTEWSGVFGWYWGASNGSAFKIEGHKAWLAVPKSAGAPTRAFSMDGEVMDILEVETSVEKEDEMYYDLSGRPVRKPLSKGMYIHQGRKVFIK